MNLRYQHGHLRCVERKNGPPRWEFLWRDSAPSGQRIRRNVVIGTIEEYPTEALAQVALNGLRACINENRNRQRQQHISVADLIDHYIETELAERSNWHSHATRIVYREYLTRWLKPCWGVIIDINRSIFQGVLGNCKTEVSRRPVPLSLDVAADLWLWKERAIYSKPDDWVFASTWAKGRKPFWPNTLLRKIIRPAAVRAGIKKRIGWHTFRHTYSTMLIANGENVKVVQELMRHANSRCTLDVYTQARVPAKREAQQRVVQMILPEERLGGIKLLRNGPDERLDTTN